MHIRHTSGRRARLAVIAITMLAAVALAGTALATHGSAQASGPLTVYPVADNPFAGAAARVRQVTTPNGNTQVTLDVFRLKGSLAGRTFGAHAHLNPCGSIGTDAGGHYTHPDPAPTLQAREIWLDFTPNRGGHGHSRATRSWTFTPPAGAKSVVIHASPTRPDGTADARLACIDMPFA